MTHALRKAFRLFVGVLFLGLIWSSQPSTAASLDGESGTLSLLSPNTTTLVAGPIPFVVGGPEVSIINFGNTDWSLQASGNAFHLGFNDRGCCTDAAAFAGPALSFTGAGFAGLASVTLVDTNIAGFGASRVSFDNQSIFVDISGGLDLRGTHAGLSVDRFVTLHVTAVPEPESYAMMLVGIATLVHIGRRRRTPLE
jgi:hypothetical protein